MGLRARGVDRKVDQKKEALENVLDFLGGRDRMTDKLLRRFSDRRTFTTEDLRELQRLFKRAISESPAALQAVQTEPDDGTIIRFRRRLDGTYTRTE